MIFDLYSTYFQMTFKKLHTIYTWVRIDAIFFLQNDKISIFFPSGPEDTSGVMIFFQKTLILAFEENISTNTHLTL